MSPERWKEIERLYQSAVELPPDQRTQFLTESCSDDELRREVESLLAQRNAPSFMERRGLDVARDMLSRNPKGNPVTVGVVSSTAEQSAPSNIGRYRIIRLIGEGGMGSVYEAEQENPRRTVALKMIRPGRTTPESLLRFEQEAQALGRLQHPGIAQIYEAGTADTGFGPQPYFAMELIHGCKPWDYVLEHNLTTGERLELVAKIADAVHHAHQRGLIHRDLKPSNILIDETGQPKVLDFGVARVTDGRAQSPVQTDLGQLVGTLAYMSPEQVLSDPLEIDTRTDVYALGIILYELLAGGRPYEISQKLHEAIRTIQEEEPAPLRVVHRSYKGDVETIVGKALQKDRSRRYTSAAELAADIRRYLKDEPIVARQPSARYQLYKFARRHKGLVAATSVVFVVLIAGVIASTFEATKARQERDRAATAEKLANDERDRAVTAQEQAITAEQQVRQERDNAVAERQRADAEAATSNSLRLIGIWQWLTRESLRASSDRSDDDLAALLARQALLIHSRVPDQPRYLVTQALQNAARISQWNHIVLRGVWLVAVSRDGRWLGGVNEKGVHVWDAGNPSAPVMTLPESTGVSFSAMTFSNDAERLAAGDSLSTVRIWDLQKPDARPVVLTEPFVRSIRSLTFSRDTSRLAAKSDPNTVKVWDLSNPAAAPIVLQARARSDYSDSPINHRPVVFSPDSKRVASADVDAIRIWDLADPATPLLLRGSEGDAVALAFALDGTHLTAAMRDNKIQTWDLLKPDAAPILLLQAPAGKVSSGAFSEDLSRVAVAADKTLRIWDLDDPRAAPIVVECPLEVRFVEITSNRSVFSFGGAVRRLDLDDPGPPRARPIKANQSEVSRLNWPVFSPSLNYMAASIERTLRVWDVRNPESDPVFAAEGSGVVTSLIFSPDGQRLVSGASDKTVHVWNLLNVKDTQVLSQGHDGPVLSLGFSTDGERLASVSVASSIRILIWKWRHFSEKPARIEFPLPTALPENCRLSITLSPDLNHLACGGLDSRILIWDLRIPARPPVSLSMTGRARVVSLAFSADSNRLASVSSGLISMWDLRNPTAQPKVFSGGGGAGYTVAFSPDGLRIASGSAIRDLRNPALPPEILNQDQFPIEALRYGPDGRRLATFSGRDGVQVLNVWSGLADYLCSRVVRNMSLNEWNQYVGPDMPYERTCPLLPTGT